MPHVPVRPANAKDGGLTVFRRVSAMGIQSSGLKPWAGMRILGQAFELSSEATSFVFATAGLKFREFRKRACKSDESLIIFFLRCQMKPTAAPATGL